MLKTQHHTAKQKSSLKRFKRSDSDPQLGSSRNTAKDSNIDENEEFFDAEESLEPMEVEEPQPGPSNQINEPAPKKRKLSPQEKKKREEVKKLFGVFIKGFVENFKATRKDQEIIAQDRLSRKELIPALKKEAIPGVTGGITGALLSKAILDNSSGMIPSAVASVRSLATFFNTSDQQKACKITDAFKTVSDGDLDKMLVKAAGEIFHSFESQFMSLTDKAGDEMAMKILATHGAFRALNYIARDDNDELNNLLTKGIILGESKGILNLGCTLQDKKGNDVNIGELYKNTGVVVNQEAVNDYYSNNNGKYGYRLPLNFENKDGVRNLLDLLTRRGLKEDKGHKETTYTNVLQQEDIETESQRILKEIEGAKPATKGDLGNLGDQLLKGLERQRNNQSPKDIKFDLRSPVENFTGRAKQLTDLHEKLGQGVAAITQKISGLSMNSQTSDSVNSQASLSGLGGIGKTQLALKYAKEYSKDYDNNVMWINAENENTLSDSFERLASKLGVEKKDADGDKKKTKDIAQEIYEYFKETKSLFILDNVKNYKAIAKYLPKELVGNKPSVLITSRYRNWENTKVEMLDLDVFTDEEAKEFIKKRLDIKDNTQDNKITELAEKLGKLPLALAQAVAYIKQSRITNRNFGISDYLEKYNEKLENVKALLGNQALKDSNDPYAETVLTTWKVTLNKIRAETNGEKAIEILNIMAYFTPENIPNEMFIKLTDEEVPQRTSSIIGVSSDKDSNQILTKVDNKESISSAIQLLQSYSMINQGAAQDKSNVHRLVQKVIRIGLKNDDKEKELLDKADALIEKFVHPTTGILSRPYEEYYILLKAAKLQYGTQKEQRIHKVAKHLCANGDVSLLQTFLIHLGENIEKDYLEYLGIVFVEFIKLGKVDFVKEVVSHIEKECEKGKISKDGFNSFFNKEKKYEMVNVYPDGKEDATIDELISALKSSRSDDQAEQKRLEDIKKVIESIREKIGEFEKLKKCVVQEQGERKKRSAENECLFDWKDVDKFNEAKKQHKRNPNKIRINSEKFIDHLKDASEEKQDQLIELADHVEVIGNAKESVGELVKHHKIKSHLQKVSKLSGQINSALMAENIGADIINGDYKDVAVNAGLIGEGAVLGKASDKILAEGVALEADKKLLGRSLKVASPFLKRGTAGFFAYNLIQNIKEYKAGDKDALGGVVTNAIFVGVDLAQAGVEAAEFLEVIAGVAEFTGPIGEAIATAIFLGTAIYHAEKQVEEIEKHVHLTRGEELWEGLRATVGLDPSKEIEERIKVKEHNNQLVKNAIEFLKKNTDFARYVFPVMEEKEQFWLSYRKWNDKEIEMFNSVDESHIRFNADKDQNKTEKFDRMVSNNARLRNRVNLDLVYPLIFSVYNRTFQSVPDSTVDLVKHDIYTILNEDIITYNLNEGEFLCIPGGLSSQEYKDMMLNMILRADLDHFRSRRLKLQYLCKNAIAVEYNVNRTGNKTLIDLGEGKDIAIGTPDSPNVFIVNNGHKNYTGGNEGDTFIVQGNSMTGTLSGGGGIDPLDFRGFKTNNSEFALLDGTRVLCSKQNQVSKSYASFANKMRCTNGFEGKNSFSIDNIEQVYGRKYKRDVLFSNKDSEYIDGFGGKSSEQQDEVHLNINSNKNPAIVLRPYTQVFHDNSGNFIDSVSYIVPRGEEGKASVYPFFNISIQHRFHFDCPVSSLRGINVGKGNITFNLHDQQKGFNVTISDSCRDFMLCMDDTRKKDYPSLPRNASYTFQDNTEIKILDKKNFYAEQNANKTAEEIISKYPEVANRLSMTMLFKLPNNETVLVGHGAHEIMHNNPSYASHLVGNGGENVYKIGHSQKEFSLDELPIPDTVIYDVDEENSIDTIDLRNLIQKKPNGTEFHGPQVLISEQGNDLILSSFLKSQNNETREYFEVVLQDGVNWSHNVDVVINGSHMKIDFNGTNYQLKPLPLIFKSDYKYIVIQPSDIEKENEIIIGKEVDNYTFARLSNDLVITNAFDQDLRESKHCSIILKDFYLESKIRTLSIKFVDKEIILKDHIEQINNATNFDTLQKEHNNTRSTILNIPDSQESTTTVNPEITTHRHQHHHGQNATAHQRGRRAISVDGVLANNNDPVFFAGQNNAITGIKHEETNGAARPSSLINDVSNWVKSSISRWIASTTSIPQQVDARASKGSWASSMGQRIYDYFTNGSFFQDNADYVNANLKQTYEEQMPIKFKPKDGSTILEMGDHYLSQVDFNGTITLLDLLIRKVTGKKPISTEGKSMSLLEAQGHALNITEKFEKVVEQAVLKSGISMHRLNIDSITIQKEITKKVMSSKFDEIAGILKSNIEKACPGRETGCPGKLSQKKFDKFITTLNDEISVALNQSTQQISHRNSALEVKEQQEPKSHLSNISVQGHLTQAKAKLIS